MKYGENFERESVPEWSLHNIDYNSLKHFIKVNTNKHEARAIAIPGQQDSHLAKVENELYHELCAQHDRAGLFVTAKADEINRRLQHLSDEVQSLISRCAASSDGDTISRKRQRKFARLDREAVRCGDDVQHLQRFVNAQVMAFRKILKKYRKWTGSSTLGTRFKENILSQPKSFTRRDFQPLQQVYDELLSTIRASTPAPSQPATPLLYETDVDIAGSEPGSMRQQSLRRVTIQAGPPQTYSYHFPSDQTLGYWNEYDNGSENGEDRDEYVLYMNPEESGSPDLKSILHALAVPFNKARSWVKARHPEHQSLLSRQSSGSSYGAIDQPVPPASGDYFANPLGRSSFSRPPPSRGNDSSTAVETDADEDVDVEAGYSSSEEFPAGYAAHYAAALPSVSDQRMDMYKDRVTFLATGGLFAAAFLLLGIATVLVVTGRHKLRVEVDAAATLGSMVSIGCGCTALALVMARWDSLGAANKAVVGVTFTTVCVLNGMLLVLVAGNTSL